MKNADGENETREQTYIYTYDIISFCLGSTSRYHCSSNESTELMNPFSGVRPQSQPSLSGVYEQSLPGVGRSLSGVREQSLSGLERSLSGACFDTSISKYGVIRRPSSGVCVCVCPRSYFRPSLSHPYRPALEDRQPGS